MKSLSERKTLYILAGALAGTGCIIMAIFPSIALESAQNGVLLWASSVLPALLPFFICSNFMIALGVPELVGRLFEEPFRRIFGAPGASAFVFTISVFSGYPTGPKLIGDMGRRGEITPKEAKRMLTFCSTSGPLFMLGAVGVGILYSSGAGVVIALSHYLGSIFNGILFRIFTGHSRREEFQGIKHTKRKTNNQARPGNIPQKNLLDIFTDSIVSSLKAMGIICGYIVLFTLITDFIQFSGILNLFQSGYTKGFIKGLFEMTVGCNSIGRVNDHQILLKSILCSFLISFGGISVMAQSMSMLSNLRISIWYYLIVKLCHGILAAGIAFLIGPYILSLDVIMTGTFDQFNMTKTLGWFSSLLFSTKAVIIVVILFVFTIFIDKLVTLLKRRFKASDTPSN